MISVFDIFSIGIGPSSSHTVGPMRAAMDFVSTLKSEDKLTQCTRVETELFGSLGQTGIGHGTGKAVILGLLGLEPETVETETIPDLLKQVEDSEQIALLSEHAVTFPKKGAIVYHRRKTLPKHSNGMTIRDRKSTRLNSSH